MANKSSLLLCLAAAAASSFANATLPLPASNLLTEYVENPIVIDTPIPRFYWLPNHNDRGITQQSYHIVVNCSTTGETVWDSGVVQSNATTHIEYAGATAITSDSVYTWAVEWTDSNGATAPWSTVAKFGTGFLTQQEWTSAAWIGCPLHIDGSTPNRNQIRTEIDIGASAGTVVTQARLYITAVGYYNVRVNGDWATQWGTARPRLDPGWTTYEYRSLYNAYDLTNTLIPNGPNAIAIMMGNGWPTISPTPGNNSYSSSSSSSADVESARVNVDALIRLRKEGGYPQNVDGENDGANRQIRLQLIVHTSDGKTSVWTSTASGFTTTTSSTSSRSTAPTTSSFSSSSSPTLHASTVWQCGAGALQYDNVYNGMTYDATQETVGWDLPNYSYATSTGNWTAALLYADPGGAHPTTMSAQIVPAVSLVQEVGAVSVSSPSPGVYVFDMGQNLAGVVRLSLPAPVLAGVNITIRHAELLMHPPYGINDGNIYVGNLRSAKATDQYTTRGTTNGEDFEVFEPFFTYHGFRFVEVTGLPYPPTLDTITSLHIRTNVEIIGNVVFPSMTANTLNQLQHAVTWGIGSNLMSVISDCDQRDERKGWSGDAGLSLLPMHYNFAMGAMYTNWARNVRDSQIYMGDPHCVGCIPDTVPHTFGNFPADPSWGVMYSGVIYEMWRRMGDTRLASDHYPNLQLYVTFMMSEVNKTGVKKLFQSYGDWCPPYGMPPSGFTSGISFLLDLQRITEIAIALGKTSDATMYQSYRDGIIAQFNSAWLNTTTGIYGDQGGTGMQTANAAAMFTGAAAAAGANTYTLVGSKLLTDVVSTHESHFSTGIIGMRFLHTALTDMGAGTNAVDTLLQTTYPSFGYEFNDPNEPATTLWELLDGSSQGPGMNSRNHHMFSSVGGWLYTDLAGIEQRRVYSSTYNPADPTAHGFRHPILFPRITTHPNVSWVEGEYSSIAGRYAITWINPNGTAGGANCVENAPENAPVTISCPPGGGVFTNVSFASFGTSTGSCGDFQLGTCNALNSTAILTAACVNKSTCTIDVSTTLFGDPCFNTVKHLNAFLTCQTSAGVSMSVSIPTNAQATVRVPLPPGATASTMTLFEGSAAIWNQGTYVPGVVGVYSAAAGTQDLPVGVSTIDVEVGSGTYNFLLS